MFIPLILIAFIGITVQGVFEHNKSGEPVFKDTHGLVSCIKEQVEDYSDLCAESSSGYETMSPSDAHRAGVECAAQSCTSN